MKRNVNLGLAITATLIAMAVTFSVTMAVSMQQFNNTVSSVKSKERMYNKLSEIDRYVRASEYFTISDDTLNDTIASGYVLGINDKYARYYSARAYAEKQSVDSGRLMGIGVAVIKDASSGYARIIRVYENSPAAEVGLQTGGYITAIGETDVKTLTDVAAINSALLGEEGTGVNIAYLSPDRQEASFEVTHTSYTVNTVRSELLQETCGYIRIDSFATGTTAEFRSAVDSLISQGATSFVFDLRDNTGDSLTAAMASADYCVPAGLIAQSQTNTGVTTDLRISDDDEITLPMVCLVNGSTAQGAELFANALRKMSGATLVGAATAGKGVQLSDPQSLSDGSAVVITVGMLLDNEGQSWDSVGLTPDVDAALSAEEQSAYYDFTTDTDPQIQRAVQTAIAMS